MTKKSADENMTTTVTAPKLNSKAKTYPGNWEPQLEQIITGLRENQIDLGGDRNADNLEAKLSSIKAKNKTLFDLENQMSDLRTARNQEILELWQLGSNTRVAVSGLFGPDSFQFESVGGKRASERAHPKPKPQTPDSEKDKK